VAILALSPSVLTPDTARFTGCRRWRRTLSGARVAGRRGGAKKNGEVVQGRLGPRCPRGRSPDTLAASLGALPQAPCRGRVGDDGTRLLPHDGRCAAATG
jgi:hypothetical protein